ncbi:MAG: bifunctional methylenetetrahydrofolate dehydrogenase/methenyltetrahydrofolate cyclohydrolase FolD [Bacteroidales bacterium]|nr:bifunctional methylenetetrahydrofolate dehydrogenase/methenyltetrahydrofolate cyclohydrolase FolD [Bacteroidales bacterium]
MLIDGKALSMSIKDSLKARIPALEAEFGRKPSLCVIMVGENPASQVYVRNKIRAAQYVGMDSRQINLPADTSEEALLKLIASLNEDSTVDGILVQLPLPKSIDEGRIAAAIAPCKDVDGLNPVNAGKLWLGDSDAVVPCTPRGIMALLDSAQIDLEGKLALVIGRSNIVGRPVSKLLQDRNATVIMAHSRTSNLAALCRQADVIIAAVGRENLLGADMVKEGATVIDVGINRKSDGTLAGDADFEALKDKVAYITPVPGGVGPMTIAMLMDNTVRCFLYIMRAATSARIA